MSLSAHPKINLGSATTIPPEEAAKNSNDFIRIISNFAAASSEIQIHHTSLHLHKNCYDPD
jgi:hypothetical protein